MAAAYFIVLVSSLFVLGMRVLLHDGLDYRKGVAVGLAFWLGLAFELDWIFPEYFQGVWGDLFANGLTVGGLTVIVLTHFVELTGPRARRLKTDLTRESFSKVDTFLADFAARGKRDEEMTDRLRAVGDELLLTLTRQEADGRGKASRHLLLVARDDGDAVDLEFAATTDEANLEDQLALLSEQIAELPCRGGGLAALAAPLRVVRPPPAVPRRGHRDGPRRPARLAVTATTLRCPSRNRCAVLPLAGAMLRFLESKREHLHLSRDPASALPAAVFRDMILVMLGKRASGSLETPRESTSEASTDGLLEQARRGNRSAVDVLFQRCRTWLRRRARGRLPAWARDGIDTSDVVHDALCRTFVRLETFQAHRASALRAYLQRAVENRIHDQLRRIQRRSTMRVADAPSWVTGNGASRLHRCTRR